MQIKRAISLKIFLLILSMFLYNFTLTVWYGLGVQKKGFFVDRYKKQLLYNSTYSLY